MNFRDPRCVFVADSLGLAEVVVLWLNEQGLPAQVMNPHTLGRLDGLTWVSPTAVAASGIEVWVIYPDQADEARRLLEEHHAQLLAEDAICQVPPGDTIVTCDECGETNVFPPSEAGKVASCRSCGAYLDVSSDEGQAAGEDDWGESEEDVS